MVVLCAVFGPGTRQKREVLQEWARALRVAEAPGVALAAQSQLPARARVRHQAADAVGQEPVGVGRRMVKDEAGLAVGHEVSEAAESGHHGRAAGGHGLGHRDPERLALFRKAWIAEDIQASVQAGPGPRIVLRGEPFDAPAERRFGLLAQRRGPAGAASPSPYARGPGDPEAPLRKRSEEHTSELQ